MRPAFAIPLVLALWSAPAPAQDIAGTFDYYVLALSWSPGWCRATGDNRDAVECDRGSNLDFVVHGLWPQYERGYPEFCDTDERDPSRRETQAMADLMAPGLTLHQWKKHGRCSGLSAADYYATMREAAARIAIPVLFDGLGRDIALPPSVIEDAFIEANPDLTFDGTTITCQGEALREVRICLTRDLDPRDCAPDVRQDCTRPRVIMERVR